MTADVSAARQWLDQLTEAREKATAGPWSGQSNRVYASGYRVATVALGGKPGAPEADAALIVAAVNAVGPLTAAVRAVLDLADEMDARLAATGVLLDRCIRPGDAIRAAVTEALGGEAK